MVRSLLGLCVRWRVCKDCFPKLYFLEKAVFSSRFQPCIGITWSSFKNALAWFFHPGESHLRVAHSALESRFPKCSGFFQDALWFNQRNELPQGGFSAVVWRAVEGGEARFLGDLRSVTSYDCCCLLWASWKPFHLVYSPPSCRDGGRWRWGGPGG